MKNILLTLLLFFSYEKEEIDKEYSGDAIWENQFYFGKCLTPFLK